MSIYHELFGVPSPANFLATKVKPLEGCDDAYYNYLLVVSSDSLYILSPDRKKIIETIIDGKDTDGYICAADNENIFLEAITDIKRYITEGRNPLDYIL